jgi:hypothetical protein
VKLTAYIIYLLIFFIGFLHSQVSPLESPGKISAFFTKGNIVPILAFDPDNGFRYGATINVYRIKKSEIDSTRRPFNDNLFLRGFHSTKNNFQSTLLLETNSLIPKSKCFLELSASKDASFEFYGVNGYQSVYSPTLVNQDHPEFISQGFYSHQKEFYKFRFDHQQFLGSPYFRMINGFSLNYLKSSHDTNQLISNYIDSDILDHNVNGQKFLQYNLGLVAENRNNQFYCTKGFWHEAMLVYSSDLRGQHFMKSILTVRNYLPVRNKKNMFLSRISFQNTLFGEIPYELMSLYYDSRLASDGIGGIFTMRGKPRNRLLAEGFILSNLEFKRTIMKRQFLKTVVNIDVSMFTDHYFITQLVALKNTSLPPLNSGKNDRYCATFGIGGYIVLNESSVITINYGYPLTKNEQGGRVYIGAGFMF